MINFKFHRSHLFLVPGLFSAGLLASCAMHPTAAPQPAHPLAQEEPQQTEPARVNGRVGPERVQPTGAIVRQDGATVASVVDVPAPHPLYRVGENGDVSLNYVDTDVREIARVILGEILKVNYAIDPGFQGTVTIQTAHPLKRDQLISTLQGLLAQAGGQITYQDDMYRIGAQGNDSDVPPVVGGHSMESGTQVVALHFASAKQLATMLETYAGDAVKIVAEPTRNVLIVSGSATARQNVLDLVRVFDVDYLAGQSYALFPVKSGDPTKLATDLQAALQLDSDGALVGAVKVVPIDEANAVMVVTRQPAYLDRIAHLMNQLDQVKLSAGRNVHIYYLKNTQPTDLQPILQLAFNPPSGGAGGQIAPGNLPPTSTPAQIGAPSASTTTTASSTPSTGMATPAANTTTPASSTTMASTTASSTTTSASGGSAVAQQAPGGDSSGPQIIADDANSALIVVATESNYAEIEDAIRKLDILPMQVLIEATIAEVSLNDSLQYGVQFFLQNKQGQIGLSNAQSAAPTIIDPSNPLTNAQLFPGLLAPSFPGLAIARTFSNVQFALQALKNVTDVQIISAPELLILDKQQATFQVGDLVPTITQSATSVITPGAPIVNNVQYQTTGVVLTVTPHINAGGLVTMDIEQDVSDVVPTTTSTINSPTFEQRKVQTKVVVQDGETISLAGLISDKKSKENSGIPLLQSIPVLGTLFSTKTNNDDRTELLVLLTPHVVHNQRDARALTEELKRKLAPSRILP